MRRKSISIECLYKELPWDDEMVPGHIADTIYVKHFDDPLVFGFALVFLKLAKKLPSDIRVESFRMKQVPHIDQSGLYTMEEVILGLESRGIAVVMSGLRGQPQNMLKRINIIPELIPE